MILHLLNMVHRFIYNIYRYLIICSEYVNQNYYYYYRHLNNMDLYRAADLSAYSVRWNAIKHSVVGYSDVKYSVCIEISIITIQIYSHSGSRTQPTPGHTLPHTCAIMMNRVCGALCANKLPRKRDRGVARVGARSLGRVFDLYAADRGRCFRHGIHGYRRVNTIGISPPDHRLRAAYSLTAIIR